MRPGELLLSRFLIESEVGRGGMGVVYRAFDTEAQQPVAVKAIQSQQASSVGRFLQEIRVLSSLNHPHIVKYLSHGQSGGELFLVMEWLDGEDLAARLSRGALSIEESLLLAKRVAAALGFVHQNGVVHRDLKPQNIFLPDRQIGLAKLIDFGIARQEEQLVELTGTGVILGTPSYLAPEQARRGAKGLDARADLYALGCVLFECLTRRPPFIGREVIAILAKILLEDPPQLKQLRPETPEALASLVAGLLSKDPEARPANGDELYQRLQSLVLLPHAESRNHITASEQKVFGVIFLGNARLDPAAKTISLQETQKTIEDAFSLFGGELSKLLHGENVIAFREGAVASDIAMRAARCALWLRENFSAVRIALAVGRADAASGSLIGAVIERGVKLLQATNPGEITLDETAEGLLRSRFQLDGQRLLGEHQSRAARVFLGKAAAFVGRERELASIEAIAVESAEESVARIVLLIAPPGVGKSRIVEELCARLMPNEPTILFAQGEPLREGAPLWLVSSLLAQLIPLQLSDPPEMKREKILAAAQQLPSQEERSGAALFLGELFGAATLTPTPLLLNARVDPSLMLEHLRRAAVQLLRAAAALRPVVLLIEDLHWSDVASIKLIESLVVALYDRPLFVLSTARASVIERSPALFEGAALTTIKLPELSKRASERMIQQALGSVPPAKLAQLFELSQGNAFYLEELCRAVREGREELPESVVAMAQARIEGLSSEERKLLRAASILGERFSIEGLSALLGAPQGELSLMVRRLVQREFFVEKDGQHLFRHSLMREAAHTMLTDEDKLLGHRLAAEWLTTKQEDPLLIGAHFEAGGQPERALIYLRQAAQRAFFAADVDALTAIVERCERLGASGHMLGELLALEAEIYSWVRFDLLTVIQKAFAAVDLLQKGSNAWFSLNGTLCGLLSLANQFEAAHQFGQALLLAPLTPDDIEPKLSSLASTVFLSIITEQIELGRALLDKLLAAEHLCAPDSLAKVWIDIARAVGQFYLEDDIWPFYCASRICAERFASVENFRFQLLLMSYHGLSCIWLGSYQEAAEVLQRNISEAGERRFKLPVAQSRRLLGQAMLYLEKTSEGLSLAREYLGAVGSTNDLQSGVVAKLNLALAQSIHGEHHEADTLASSLHAIPAQKFRALAFALSSRSKLAMGRREAALIDAELGYQSLLASTPNIRGGYYIYHALVEALLAAQQRARLNEILREARSFILTLAGKIPDPEHRQSFLQIPEQARILALAEVQLQP